MHYVWKFYTMCHFENITLHVTIFKFSRPQSKLAGLNLVYVFFNQLYVAWQVDNQLYYKCKSEIAGIPVKCEIENFFKGTNPMDWATDLIQHSIKFTSFIMMYLLLRCIIIS